MTRIETIKSKYNNESLLAGIKEVPVQGWDYAKENPWKTIAVVGGTFLAVALTAAYVLSPAYAARVAVLGAKAGTAINAGISAVSGFLAANPLVAPLIMIAALATIVTLAYMNHSKSSQINVVKEEVLKACEKDGDKPKIDDGKLKPTGDASTFLNGVAVAVGLAQAPAK
ncbi:hypothetical protein [Wolbachia endosymbiont of Folsomia candida]|uniref:hypothetical protein n=1 Tax=Wolbachia endosymbiont of Folsomia candida TaxID=169402 RepID=UPI000AED29A8|nr:hypothetical protein [Wolbachia endosymbiont of Folsomia candida]APR98458.1 hypothetical protein ASM33_04255 [Wolbachia endosymbiont of Folsomia candida]